MPDARRAMRKPAAVGYILVTNYRALIASVLMLAAVILLAPTVVDSVTSTVFPPESKTLLGLVTTAEEHPLRRPADVFIMTTLWILAVSSTLLLFWLDIPKGLVRANARSARLLAKADETSDEVSRRSLCHRALATATDPEIEAALVSRLQEMDSGSSGNQVTAVTQLNDRHGTIVESSTLLDIPSSRPATPSSDTGLGGRYSLTSELGKGAMGVVFSAWDTVLDRKVAIKQLSMILAGDDEHAARFRQEAKALARLTHPNVVQVYDLIEVGHRLWMVLEHVDGGDLAALLKKESCLTAEKAVSIILPAARGLAFAHSQGIVHRDIKPSNILLTSQLVPKISDFGIAKLTQSGQLTQIGTVMGSPPYMSPEQCSGGAVDSRTDIYSLGITLYELLTGKVPFAGDTASVLARQIVEQPAPLSDANREIPLQLEQLVFYMLAKSPDQRPHNMTAVVDRLTSLAGVASKQPTPA